MSSTTPLNDHEHFYVPNRPAARANRLLVRSEVGMQRRSTFKLPDEQFAYGKPADKGDSEGAGAVVLNWIGFKPNAAAQPARNFVKLNRDATVAGCVNATEATKFRDTHDARIIPGSGRARKARQDAAMHLELRTFGKPSDVPTPVSSIISNAYQADWVKKATKIMESNPVKPKGALPLPVPTKASLGQAQSARKFAPTKKVFVLKRFQNIPGKMTYEDMHREFIPAAQREAQAKAAAAAAAASPAPVSP